MQMVDDKIGGESKAPNQIGYAPIDGVAKDGQHASPNKQCQFFAFKSQGEASVDEDEQQNFDEVGFHLENNSEEQPIGVSPQFNATTPTGISIQKQINKDAEVPIM